VADDERSFEYMMNRLRLRAPFTLDEFESRAGLPAAHVMPILIKAQQKKLMQEDNGQWQVTSHGHRYLNDLLEMFL